MDCSVALCGKSVSLYSRRLMFPSKISPSLNIPDLHPKVTYCYSEGSTVSSPLAFNQPAKRVWQTVHPTASPTVNCRSWMAWRCLAWSTLWGSRKDFWRSKVSKRQPRWTVCGRRQRGGRQGRHMGPVRVRHVSVFPLAMRCHAKTSPRPNLMYWIRPLWYIVVLYYCI